MSKPKWIIVAMLIGLVILVPIAFYLYYFRNFGIGTDPEKWGQLGDYFGGVLNPMISLASLCVLGYLTYLFAAQSDVTNRKLFIVEKQMIAYDELLRFMKDFNMISHDMRGIMRLQELNSRLPIVEQAKGLIDALKEMQRLSRIYTEFHHTVFGFDARFGHLFNYDFKSDDFRSLIEQSGLLSKGMESHSSNPNIADPVSDAELLTRSTNMFEIASRVFKALRTEIRSSQLHKS